jgi:hypothetical protein
MGPEALDLQRAHYRGEYPQRLGHVLFLVMLRVGRRQGAGHIGCFGHRPVLYNYVAHIGGAWAGYLEIGEVRP